MAQQCFIAMALCSIDPNFLCKDLMLQIVIAEYLARLMLGLIFTEAHNLHFCARR